MSGCRHLKLQEYSECKRSNSRRLTSTTEKARWDAEKQSKRNNAKASINKSPKNPTEEILNDRGLQDQSKMLKKMIENYMKITDTTIRDLVPKYVMFALVSATQKYVREELVGDILKGRNSDAEKAELLEASSEYSLQIKELLDIQSATQKAMEVFLSIK